MVPKHLTSAKESIIPSMISGLGYEETVPFLFKVPRRDKISEAVNILTVDDECRIGIVMLHVRVADMVFEYTRRQRILLFLHCLYLLRSCTWRSLHLSSLLLVSFSCSLYSFENSHRIKNYDGRQFIILHFSTSLHLFERCRPLPFIGTNQ